MILLTDVIVRRNMSTSKSMSYRVKQN